MSAKITICADEEVGTIHPNLYGHFAEHLGRCIYEGVWVGEDSPIPNTRGIRNDVVQALKRIKPPIVRWPGGCFADDYHWRDGIGAHRPRHINTHWGQVIETNGFGTHEFIDFCRQVGATPYICGNVGSGTPREMRDWVEYCNFDGQSALAQERAANGSPDPFGARYWGVGNENWGCGGHMLPEEYAAHYRRFSTYLFDFSNTRLFLIACGPSSNDPDWTHRFFEGLGRHRRIHGFSAHYYCGTAGTATAYTEVEWYTLIERASRVERLITQQRAIMDGYDPERRIGLIIDEWGTWHPPTEGHNPRFLWQQSTIRDALVAALTLDTFNRHTDKVIMGNIAQTINVLQAMILTEGEKMLTTPTYHVYEMYVPHQGAQSLRVICEAEPICFGEDKQHSLFGLNASASLKEKTLSLSVVNPDISQPVETAIQIYGDLALDEAAVRVLSHSDIHAYNTFDAPDVVKPTNAAPLQVRGKTFQHTFPPASVSIISMKIQ